MGNILNEPLFDMIFSEKQQRFGANKIDALPDFCLNCEFLNFYNGEYPKNRISMIPYSIKGLNYLCRDLKRVLTYYSVYEIYGQ